jgi:hypothetical protein
MHLPASAMRFPIAVLMLSFTLNAGAQSSGFGLGLVLGEPTGISAKGWTGPTTAIDGALAWSLWNGSYIHLHADYLFHDMDLIHLAKGRLPLYYGPGLRLHSWTGDRYWERGRWYTDDGTRTDLAVRFPVGLDYLPEKAPVDVFLEIVPTLDLVPSSWFEFDGAIGVRYWF